MEVGIVVSWGRWNLCKLCDVIKSRETMLVGRNSFVVHSFVNRIKSGYKNKQDTA